MNEKEVQKLRKEKMVPYIADPTIKAANMINSNLAQDLRKSKNIVTLRQSEFKNYFLVASS